MVTRHSGARIVVCLPACLALLLAVPAAATVYVVHADGSGDYPDIQAAIMACDHGDVVELADGVYTGPGNRDLHNNETAVLIRSQSGDAAACVVDLGGTPAEPHRFITLVITGEQPRQVWGLHDLTVTGGWAEYGGAVLVYDWASPEIHGCVFRGNTAVSFGGAIAGGAGVPHIAGCWFEGNTAEIGGAISGHPECLFTVEDCTFVANTAVTGGAVYSFYDLGSTFTGCTFAFNTAEQSSGLDLHAQNPLTLERCLIAAGSGGAAITVADGTEIALTCCDVFGNEGGDWVGAIAPQLGQNGNIAAEPHFCDVTTHDLHLHDGSPCAPGTPPNPECAQIGAWPVGCGPIAVERRSWRDIKELMRGK